MKGNAHSSYGFFMELLLVLLFFSLSAVILLQVFLTARQKSDDAALRGTALIVAQSLLEESLADGQPHTQTFVDKSGETYTATVDVAVSEESAAGLLFNMVATVTDLQGNQVIPPLESSLFQEGTP